MHNIIMRDKKNIENFRRNSANNSQKNNVLEKFEKFENFDNIDKDMEGEKDDKKDKNKRRGSIVDRPLSVSILPENNRIKKYIREHEKNSEFFFHQKNNEQVKFKCNE